MCETDNTAGTAIGSGLIENDCVRVTEWRFKQRGDNTGWHKHAYDYVVVPLFDGFLEIETPNDGRIAVPMQNGVPYFRKAGVEHDVINGNDFECAFIEVEITR